MKRSHRGLIAVLLGLAWLGALSLPGVAGEREVQVSLKPKAVSLRAGERRQVALVVKGVPEPGLAAFQVTLAYDPAQVEVVDPNEGQGVAAFSPLGDSPLCAAVRGKKKCPDAAWMLTSTGREALGTAMLDAEAGEVTVAYATMGEALLPVGNGTLAVIELVGKGKGKARLEVIDVLLIDNSEPPHTYAIKGPKPHKSKGRR